MQQFLDGHFRLPVGVELFEDTSVFGEDAVDGAHHPVGMRMTLVVVGATAVVGTKFLVCASCQGLTAGEAASVVHE